MIEIQISKSKVIKALFFLILMIIVYASLIYLTGFISESQVQLTLNLFLLGGLIYIISLAIRAYRYTLIININNENQIHRFKIALIGVYMAWGLNSFLPGRLGEVSRIYYANRIDGISSGEALDSIIIEKIFDFLAMATLGIVSFGLINLRLSSSENSTNYFFFFLFIIGISLFSLFVMVNINYFSSIFEKIPLVGKYLKKLMIIIQRKTSIIFTEKKNLAKLSILSLIIWTLDTLVFLIVLASLDIIPLDIAVFSVLIGYLTFIFPILPNAAGQFESAVGLVFKSLGYEFTTGFNAALLDHIIKSITAVTMSLLMVLVTIFMLSTRLTTNNDGSSIDDQINTNSE